jgi:tetratricopeptide (TPR) repeat protein/transcriptional regulator with XRE-family HTH domain
MKKPVKTTPNLQLKRARERRGWSQEHVGQELGTDSFTVSRWERGITMPSPYFRQKLCTLFDLSATELALVPQEMEGQEASASARPEEMAPTTGPILDPAIPPPPAGGHGLVGRDELLRSLKQQLLAGRRVALSALNGLPGVGKTALATALATDDEVRAYFSDGVLWAGLGYEPDILGLLSRWGTVLNCTPADLAQRSRPEAWATCIHAAIGQRRMLLVIDDAWEIAQALAFQIGGPNCAHLVTTRFPEIARRFAAEGAITVGELEDTDGRLLLMRLAPEVVQAEPEASQALVAAVGGLPLALTLLGNFLRVQSYSGHPRRLRAALERLHSADARLRLAEPQALIGSHPGMAAGTPLSLQAVIGMSDQQVNEEARATLRALAVFPPKPNTFSEDAAIAVSAMPVEALDVLTDAGLVESSGPGRYTLHQTIADYARTHLSDATVTGRLVAYYVAYMEAHTTNYEALDIENTNILAALEAAFEQKILPDLVRGVHAFVPLLITRGLFTVAEAQLQRSLEAAKVLGDDIGRATALLQLGKIAEQRGNYVQAQTYWQNGLTLARESGHRSSVAQTLRELGNLAWMQGQLHYAQQCLEEALDMLRQLDDQGGIADTLKNLGHLAADQGQPELARQLYKEARDIYQLLGDRRGFAASLHNMGIMAREQGKFEQAYQLYEEALTILRELKDLRNIATILNNLGNLSRQQGQTEQARQYLEEAVSLQRQLEHRRGFAFALFNLGSLCVDLGQLEQADQLLNEALSIFQDLQDRRNIALTLQTLAIVAREKGQMEQAHKLLDETLAISQNLNDKRWIALTFREQGILARKQEQFEQAHRLYEEALDIFLQLGDQGEAAITRLEQGILARQQEHLEEAAHLLLSAAVGLELLALPDARNVGKMLEQVRIQMGEDAFTTAIRQTLQETPEVAYGLNQAEWDAAIRKLTK